MIRLDIKLKRNSRYENDLANITFLHQNFTIKIMCVLYVVYIMYSNMDIERCWNFLHDCARMHYFQIALLNLNGGIIMCNFTGR